MGRREYVFLLSPSPFYILNPPTSPLKSVFDLPQLSVSFNMQDGGEHSSPPKKYHCSHRKICLLCRLTHFQTCTHTNVHLVLKSREVKRTNQDSINELII